jgi:hypothetical protein
VRVEAEDLEVRPLMHSLLRGMENEQRSKELAHFRLYVFGD